MQIQTNETEFCKVVAQYVADSDEVAKQRELVLEKVVDEVNGTLDKNNGDLVKSRSAGSSQLATKKTKTKPVSIAGYRPGKAPAHVIKHKYKKLIDERVQKELIAKAHEDIVFETKMKTIFYPDVLHANLEDNHFECNLLFLKKPEVVLQTYKGLEIPKPHVPKTLEEVTGQMMQELRTNYADVAPFSDSDFTELGDKITMDVECSSNPELSKTGEYYSLGSNEYFKDFDDNILGMKAGEVREFDLPNENNEKFTFKVTVHMGVKTVPCPLDDSFAQKLNVENYETLHNQVQSAAQQQIANFEKTAIKDQISKQLVVSHNFEVPDFLVEMDAEQLASEYGFKLEELDQNTKSQLVEKSRERVKLSLIFETIRENEPECQFSSHDILEVLKTRMESQGRDANQELLELQKSGKLFGMIAGLQQEAMFEFLISKSRIVGE